MHCQKCGKKLKPGEKFCSICGYYNSEDEMVEEENIVSDNWDDISTDSDIEIEIDDDSDDSEKWFDDDITVIDEDIQPSKEAKESFWEKKKKEQAEKKAQKEKEKLEKQERLEKEKAEKEKEKIKRQEEAEKEKLERQERLEQEKEEKRKQEETEKEEKRKQEEAEREEQEYKKALERKAKKEVPTYEDFDDDNNSFSEDENENFIKAYIGEDYEKIRFKNYNIFAGLLNWAYVLYRKLYITGILGLIITLIVILKFPKFAIIYAILVILLLCFGFNKYYVFISKIVIRNQQKKFEGTDDRSMEKILSRKGGVNVVLTLILYCLFLVALIYGMFHFTINQSHNEKFWNENTTNSASCISLTKIAYKDLPNEEINGQVIESTCKVTINDSNNEYGIYLKILDGTKNIYAYYQTEGSYLKYRGNTKIVGELEQKLASNTISDQEKSIYNDLKSIELTYNDVYEKAKDEEKQITEKTNTRPRTDFYFTKEEITR